MARYDGIEYGFRADVNTSTEALYATTRSMGFNKVVCNRILTGNYFLLTKYFRRNFTKIKINVLTCRNYEKYFNQALKVRRLISEDFDRVWEDVQVLLTPTTLSTAPSHSDFVTKTNRDQCAVQDFCTQPANMAGESHYKYEAGYVFKNIAFRNSSDIRTDKTIKERYADQSATHGEEFERADAPCSCQVHRKHRAVSASQ